MRLDRCLFRQIFGKLNMSTSEIAHSCKKEVGNGLIIADNSEPRLLSELKNFGLNIRPTIKKKGSILSGIAFNARLSNGS